MVSDIYPYLNLMNTPEPMNSAETLILTQLKDQKNAVQHSINNIREFKKQQKALYRSYYVTKDALDATIAKTIDNPNHEIYKSFGDIDVQEIFYEKKK